MKIARSIFLVLIDMTYYQQSKGTEFEGRFGGHLHIFRILSCIKTTTEALTENDNPLSKGCYSEYRD